MTIRPLALSVSIAIALAVAPAAPVWAQSPPAAAQPDPAAVATATAAFKKGTTLFQQKKYGLALAEFQKSYDTVNSPNSLLYVARCQAETGQLKDAYRTFSRVIAEAEARVAAEPKYVPTRDSANNERDELAKKIALVTVEVTGGDDQTRVSIGGAPLPRDEWSKPQPMDPGPTQIELVVGSQPPVTRDVVLEVGRSETVQLDAAPAPVAEAPPPVTSQPPEDTGGDTSPLVPIGIATAGVGVVGLAVFAIVGSMSNSTYGDLETLCGGERACPEDRQAEAADLQDSGSTQQTLANVGLIVGAVGVTAGVTLLVIGLSSDDGGTEAATAPSTSLAVGPGFTGVRGSF